MLTSARTWFRQNGTPLRRKQKLRFIANGLASGTLIIILILGLLPGFFAPFDAMAEVGGSLVPPGRRHLLGTDDLGRDLLSMLIAGARGTLILTVITLFLTYFLGWLIGVVAGYLGGMVDAVLMRLTEFVGILPRLLVLLLVATLIEPSLIGTSILLGATSWPGLARMIRSETISQKYREHIIAARALGCSEWHIIRKHISGAAMAPMLAVVGPICASAILIEASLGFLGLSDPDFVSWGDLIRNGQLFYYQGWWLAVFPGLTIVLICVAISVLTETKVSQHW